VNAIDTCIASCAATSVEQINVAELLLAYLDQLHIGHVFGIPGGAIEPLYDALARSEQRGGVRAVVSRHEAGAAFMADGYACQTGSIGVCCATTGPGATNLITGVASAYANRIPLLVITAQTALNTFGRGAFQESSCTGINTIGMFEYCTVYNTLVSHVDQFEHKLVTALMTACGPTPGPAHLSIPLNVMRDITRVARPSFDIVRLLNKPTLLDTRQLEQLCQHLMKSRKVAFLIGEGASSAIGTILSVAWLLDAQLLTTPHGKGLVSPYHPQYRGVIGFAGHRSAQHTLADPELDTVVCIGASLGEWASNGWDGELLLNNRLIHIDERENNFTATPMARLHVRGNIQTVFEALEKHLENHLPAQLVAHKAETRPCFAPNDSTQSFFTLDDGAAYNDNSVPLKPQRLMHQLPQLFPPQTRYFADTGTSFAWGIHYLHPYDRRLMGSRNAHGGLFRASLEFASMGWAIGAAIGAALANRHQPMVCITGDGSYLMSGQELSVAVQERLPVVFVVLNDSSLGMVKHGQRLARAEAVGTAIPFTDFAAMAASMGAFSHRIDCIEDLLALNGAEIIGRDGPTLLDVRIDPEAVPPIGSRISQLRNCSS
jgi:acetolactate synthase-1/2/3 large subunit